VANLDLTRGILTELGLGEELVRYVADRPGHDRRYALDCAKMRALGWQPQVDFAEGLARTVAWYAEHRDWWQRSSRCEWRAVLRAPVSGTFELTGGAGLRRHRGHRSHRAATS